MASYTLSAGVGAVTSHGTTTGLSASLSMVAGAGDSTAEGQTAMLTYVRGPIVRVLAAEFIFIPRILPESVKAPVVLAEKVSVPRIPPEVLSC